MLGVRELCTGSIIWLYCTVPGKVKHREVVAELGLEGPGLQGSDCADWKQVEAAGSTPRHASMAYCIPALGRCHRCKAVDTCGVSHDFP